MATQTIELKLDIIPGAVVPVIHVSQTDKTWRKLKFLLHARGSEFTIPSGTVALVNGKKADGKGFSYEGTVDTESAAVTIGMQEQMSAYPGPVIMEVMLQNGDEIIGSANLIMMVEPGPLYNAEMSDSDMQAVTEAVAKIAQALAAAQTATKKATAASSSASAAAGSASDALAYKNQAKEYRDEAEQFKDDAAGYAGAASYSFYVKAADGIMYMRYKEGE